MEVTESVLGQNVVKSSSSASEKSTEISFEKTGHGSVASNLQLQKSFEQSASSSTRQSHGVEKSLLSTESVSTSLTAKKTKTDVKTVEEENSVSVSATISVAAPATESKSDEEEEEEEDEEEVEYEEVDDDDEDGDEEEVEEIEEETEEVVQTKKQVVVSTPVAKVAETVESSERAITETVSEKTVLIDEGNESIQLAIVEESPVQSKVIVTEKTEQESVTSAVTEESSAKIDVKEEVKSEPQVEKQPSVEETAKVVPQDSPQPQQVAVEPEVVQKSDSDSAAKPPVEEVTSQSVTSEQQSLNESISALRIGEKQASIDTTVPPPKISPSVEPRKPSLIQQQSLTDQLKEIVSDMDRAIEQHDTNRTVYTPKSTPLQSQSTTSQSSTITEIIKKTTTSQILQPSYHYQENTTTTTPFLSKPIDLQKIFTPANDAEEILPQRNRKLYASSAFYTPGLHPTVEDQVELARLISSSLSDTNNNLSKGQTMYTNRKKRSVKWVHEGEGKNDLSTQNGYGNYQTPVSQYKDEKSYSKHYESKLPLKLVMDPRGIVQDVHTQGITYDHSSGMLSPDKCAELVSALHTDTPKGKGAELFAKRRKRSEKWIVDETTRATSSPSATSYSAGPTQLYDTNNQYNVQPKLVENQADYRQSQWETNRRENINPYIDNYPQYQQQQQQRQQPLYQPPPPPAKSFSLPKESGFQPQRRAPNSQRDLAYKPSVPQGWNAPPLNLPNEMFTPPEIPLSGYVPPQTNLYLPPDQNARYPHYNESAYQVAPPQSQSSVAAAQQSYYKQAQVPPNIPSYNVSPTYKKLQPSQVYSQQQLTPNLTPKPFTPSPISSEKLAIFEPELQYNPPVIRRPLTIPNQFVRNVSPTPFGSRYVGGGGGSPAVNIPLKSYQNDSYSDSYQSQSWQSYDNKPISQQSNRLSGCSFGSGSTNYTQSARNPRISLDLNQAENYNRAARGWGQSKDYYRPISFAKPVELPYTDF